MTPGQARPAFSRLPLALALLGAVAASAPAAAQPASASEVAPGIFRLSGVDEDLPQDELAPLDRILGRAEVVGLGEAFHATRGFSRAKFRLFKYLVERQGFRVFGFESPWIEAERVAVHVETCAGDAADALGGLVGVWQNESVLELLEWMCAYNREHPDDPVAFYGFDHQQGWHDAPALKQLLVSFGIPAGSPRVAGLDACEGATADSARRYFAGRQTPVPLERHERCMDALRRDWRFLTRRARRLVDAGELAAKDVAWAKIHLVGLRAWQEQMFYFDSERPRSFEARDAGMAYIAQEIRNLRFPGVKTALWAHNAHLAAGGKYLPETLDMGFFLREDLGRRYQAVALVALETEIDWPSVGCGPARIAAPDSLEAFLAAFGEPYLLIDLETPAADRPFDPDAEWRLDGGLLVPSEEYRALVYLDRAERMRPVGRPACAPRW